MIKSTRIKLGKWKKDNAQKYLYYLYLKLFLYIAFPIVLLLLSKDYFDNQEKTICLSVLIFDLECYACGMTRAIMHLIHLDFETAYAYNALSFIAFPAVCILYVLWFIKDSKLTRKVAKYIKKHQNDNISTLI